MKTVIMAGGKGTRISKLFPDIPKPLIPISDGIETKAVLEWEIDSLSSQGFREIILTIGHMADKIIAYFGDGSRFGVRIRYFVEKEPLGNAGALFQLKNELTEPFLLLNGDAVFNVDFNRFVSWHKAQGGLVSLFTHPNSHPYDSGLIVTDRSGAVTQWLTKEDTRPQYYKNRVNAGLHIIDPIVLETVGLNSGRVDLDRQILKPLCEKGVMFAYDSPEYCKDMGTPERFEQVRRDFAAGIVSAKNLSKPQKAVFLDRDGTINKHVGFLRHIEDFELLDGTAEAIRRINESGYLVVVVTNQPVIARGEVTVRELEKIHEKMETELGMSGAYIDALYYCPHHPHKGYPGEIEELKIDCDCRKPKPGMILSASIDFNINLSASWMIGDGENDVRCGENAGCHTALLSSDPDVDFGQDLTASNLLDAVKKIFG